MMPWWSWLVIWVLLVVGLLGMLAFFAFRLFRKAVQVFTDLGDLTEKVELLDAASDEPEPVRFERAILQRRAVVAARRELVRERSSDRRAARREARIDRGRALTRVDASSRRWFHAD